MKSFYPIVVLLIICCKSTLFAQTNFEGILTTRVTMAGIDLSTITEDIDYQKGNIPEQVAKLYSTIPAQDLARMQKMMEENPMMGLAMVMTPPKATIQVKGPVAYIKTRGLGYEIQHYHNTQTNEAYLYTASLINPTEAVTAAYKPSEGYEALFKDEKRITTDKFKVERSTKTLDVAGYPCSISTYTPKTIPASSIAETAGLEIHKLVVYSNKDLPQGINFSHPYYLPEENGIMRIDIYLSESTEPTMVYEMTDVKKTAISDSSLTPKKTEPIYTLTDMNYSMKVLGILMGSMAAMEMGDDEGDNLEN